VFDVFWTVAVNCTEPFVSTFAVLWLRLTVTDGITLLLLGLVGAGFPAVLAETEGDPEPQAQKKSEKQRTMNTER
jgi:hypothetical protein